MDQMVESVLAFIRAHEVWGAPIVFALSFGESLALISLLLPATVILWGVGALIGASGLDFWPLWFVGRFAVGAVVDHQCHPLSLCFGDLCHIDLWRDHDPVVERAEHMCFS
jgi:membrane protein DedA with SNARE-associated domain